jgi:hypothetical protein
VDRGMEWMGMCSPLRSALVARSRESLGFPPLMRGKDLIEVPDVTVDPHVPSSEWSELQSTLDLPATDSSLAFVVPTEDQSRIQAPNPCSTTPSEDLPCPLRSHSREHSTR